MIHDANLCSKMKYLNENHSLVLVSNDKQNIFHLHSLRNYWAETILQPINREWWLLPSGWAPTLKLSNWVTVPPSQLNLSTCSHNQYKVMSLTQKYSINYPTQ